MRRTGIRRTLLMLSLANWALAIVCWAVSAYLGMTQPTTIFTYTVLFVIGLFAVVVAIASFLLEKFAVEPAHEAAAQPAAAAAGELQSGDGGPGS
jgi:hypothetical protein